jgi:hypothetical protein
MKSAGTASTGRHEYGGDKAGVSHNSDQHVSREPLCGGAKEWPGTLPGGSARGRVWLACGNEAQVSQTREGVIRQSCPAHDGGAE